MVTPFMWFTILLNVEYVGQRFETRTVQLQLVLKGGRVYSIY